MASRAKLLLLLPAAWAWLAPRRRPLRAAPLHALTTPDVVSPFGRLAETTCVDENGNTQTATKPKWIPAYAERAGHTPAWRTAIFGGAEAVGFDAFQEGLERLPFEMPLAAPQSEAARQYLPAGGAAAWVLCGGGDGDLTVAACAEALLALAPENDGVHWTDWSEACDELETTRVTDWSKFVDLEDEWEASLEDEGSADLMSNVGAGGTAPPPPPPPPPGEKRTAGGLYLG